ncbi:MAG TPA: hypothetical protein VFV87_05325 [Pirellulaceae bacterium]|nr:hypothetical protein [Pirellulaceae bacterium]
MTRESMTRETMTCPSPTLGQKLGRVRSIPELIQAVICLAAVGGFIVLWRQDAAPVLVLAVGAIGAAVALCGAAYCLPVICSSLTIYEGGLELNVGGKTTVIPFEALQRLETEFTDQRWKGQYVGTRARLQFFVDGRTRPHNYTCDYRHGQRKERTAMLAIDKCHEAIQMRLLAELEQKGALPWRGNVSLTAEGIKLTDSPISSRLVPFREISAWKLVEDNFKIWKGDDALPCVVVPSDTPNFFPLCGLFELLCSAQIEPAADAEPELAQA